jgi:hypothetical protein
MTISEETIRILAADEGNALRRQTDKGPTRITRVALASWDSPDNWTDCEYAQTEEDSAAEVIPAPRTFSKYRLVSALMAANVWPQVKAWIESVPGAYDLYLAAEDISEDEQLLKDGIGEMKKLLGWTDAQVEEVLAASVKEGY